MGSIDAILRRGLVIASIIIVVVLSAVAIFSLVDNTTTEDAEADTGNPAPPGRAFPGIRVQVDDQSFPLSVGCLPAAGTDSGEDEVFSIVLKNLGTIDVDYVVAAMLTDQDGGTQEVVVDVPRLQPGQEVEQFVVPGRDLGEIDSCAITAVQTDRRVLLFD